MNAFGVGFECMHKISILIPVRNEGVNLRIMLKILKAVVDVPHEVLVIYDFPDDDSVPVVQELARDYPYLQAVHNQKGAGVHNALRAGVEAARGDYVLIFAADEVGPILALEEMIALMDEGCDLVSCTRYAHGGRRLGGSFVGGILSRLANRLFYHLSGSGLTDCTTGVKIFRRSLFAELDLQARPVGWVIAFELAIKAQLAGCKLGEVPIISIDRLYGGKSTFRLGAWTVEYFKWFCRGLWTLRKLGRPEVAVRVPAAYRSDLG